MGQSPLRVANDLVQYLADPKAERLEGQHLLPVAHGKAYAIVVDGYDAGVHLRQSPSVNVSEIMVKVRYTLKSRSPHKRATAKSSTALVSCAL
jgi:hypothetical protein